MAYRILFLGIVVSRSPRGFWKNPENIEEAARRIYEQNGHFSRDLLRGNGKNSLAYAINTYYPGGVSQLRINLGWDLLRKDNYWTPQTVEDEAREFIRQNGSISQNLLTEKGRSDLAKAISNHYPGKLGVLKVKLGLTLPSRPTNHQIDIPPEKANQQLEKLLEAKDGN